jgi:hypothetical protein
VFKSAGFLCLHPAITIPAEETEMDKNAWRALLRRARRGDTEPQWEVGCHYRDGDHEAAEGLLRVLGRGLPVRD